MTIDMHAHWIPEELSTLLRQRTAPPRIGRDDAGVERMYTHNLALKLQDGFDDPKKRLESMDRLGIDLGVLSLTSGFGVEALPVEEALPLVRAFNNSVSALTVEYPHRFAGLAALPFADIRIAAMEFERAMNLPGIIGALMPGDGFLSLERAERMRPLFDVAQRHAAHVLIHNGPLPDDPDSPRVVERSDNVTARVSTIDMQARISQHMVTLCLTDFLKPYPDVTVQSHNLGGNIPFEVERMDHRAADRHPDEDLPSVRFRRAPLIYDCNSFGARAIACAIELYGVDKIVFGTDGTDFGSTWVTEALADGRFTDADRKAILHDNAARLLARFRPAAQAAE